MLLYPTRSPAGEEPPPAQRSLLTCPIPASSNTCADKYHPPRPASLSGTQANSVQITDARQTVDCGGVQVPLHHLMLTFCGYSNVMFTFAILNTDYLGTRK